MTNCTFRPAVPGDEELILSFIRALAEYEHMSDQVIATPEILREWLFEKKTAEVIFAEGRAGIYLEDLFVLPEERGSGYGKALLKELARITVERGCGRLEWACLDWNQPSIDFYTKKMYAVPMDEWTVYRLTGEILSRAARPD